MRNFDSFFTKWGLTTPADEYIESKLYLEDYLHPTLIDMAKALDWSINRLQIAAEMLISRQSEEAFSRTIDLQKLGETAMLNYATFASVGRSSRAYCIGLRYSVYETVAASGITLPAEEHICNIVTNLRKKIYDYDDQQKKIAENVIDKHKNKLQLMPSILQSGILQKSKAKV